MPIVSAAIRGPARFVAPVTFPAVMQAVLIFMRAGMALHTIAVYLAVDPDGLVIPAMHVIRLDRADSRGALLIDAAVGMDTLVVPARSHRIRPIRSDRRGASVALPQCI
jgi:hypothetical protein